MAALTADGGRGPEDLRDLRVHLDQQVLLLGDLLMAELDLLLDPLVEGLAEDGRDDVADPLLLRLGDLERRMGQVAEDMRVMVGQELEHLLHTEPFVPMEMDKG